MIFGRQIFVHIIIKRAKFVNIWLVGRTTWQFNLITAAKASYIEAVLFEYIMSFH